MTIAPASVTPGGETQAGARFNAYGIALVLLCLLVAMTEGYDAVAMSLAAPILSKAWAITPKATGVLLTASVVGMMLGSFLLAPLGDRWGRRPTILISLAVAGLGTLAGAFVHQFNSMLAVRIIAGIGLGSAIPNILAIAMEVAPNRFRTFTVVLVSCGYPLGAALGSTLVVPLALQHGHAAIFAAGGIGTLAAALLCVLLLPESPSYMRYRPRLAAKLARQSARLGWPAAMPETAPEPSIRGQSAVRALFSRDYIAITILIWLVGFANMELLYFFISWLPSLLVAKGLGLDAAINANAVFNSAGIVGGLLLANAVNRWTSTYVFGACYAVALASIIFFAAQSGGALFWLTITLCGAFVAGTNSCFNAVVNQFYPAMIRTTGAGYAAGAGRLGAITAPLIGGWVMEMSSSVELTFAVAAIPAVVALVAIILLHTATTFSHRISQRLTGE